MKHTSTPTVRFALPLLLALLLVVSGCTTEGMVGPEEDTSPPTVSITDPVANAELAGDVTLQATVTDDGAVDRVEFYADGTRIGESTSSPWTLVWNTLEPGDGPMTLQAKAYDAAGNQGISSTVPVRIKNGFKLTFRNSTPTSVTINPSGHGARVVASGKTTTFTYASNPGSVSYRASARGRYGVSLSWNKTFATSGDAGETVSLAIGSGYFHLRGRNSSSRTPSSLYVNYQASNETEVKPFSLGSSMSNIGYFRGSGATRIRIYAKYQFGDLGAVYWDFASDIVSRRASFTLVNGTAAAKQAGNDGTPLQVTLEPEAALPTEGLVHEPDGAEDL